MPIKGFRIPRSRYLERGARELSRSAQLRLSWMDHYPEHGQKAAFPSRHFGISRQTFYRWKRRQYP